MNITLSPETEKRVQETVDSGLYRSASELVTEAIHRLLGETPSSGTAGEQLFSGTLSAREALADYIGACDSSAQTPNPRYRSAFGDILDEKFAKQGITFPEWER